MHSERDERVDTQTLASVDLGSNSFHLLIVRESRGELKVVDKMRERVAIAGLTNERFSVRRRWRERVIPLNFSEDCRYTRGQRESGRNEYSEKPSIERCFNLAQKALGHRVEVISGAEEARLIMWGCQ